MKLEMTISSRDQLIKLFRMITRTGFQKPWRFSIKLQIRKRSLDQNALIHAMFNDMALETGYTPAEMKAIAKEELLPKVPRRVGSRTVYIPKPTSELNKMEAMDFIERLYVLGNGLGVNWSEYEAA